MASKLKVMSKSCWVANRKEEKLIFGNEED